MEGIPYRHFWQKSQSELSWKKKARDLTMVPMSSREKSDLLLPFMGAYTPLEGLQES